MSLRIEKTYSDLEINSHDERVTLAMAFMSIEEIS